MWLTKIKKVLTPESESVRRVRALLNEALHEQASIELEPLKKSSLHNLVLSASLEDVRENELIISQPLAGALNHPLLKGEQFRLLFASSELGHLSGKTEALGKIQVTTGSDRMIHGYRMSLPASLRVEDRRKKTRLSLGPGPPPAAALYPRPKSSPLRGTVKDISPEGMLIQVLHDADREFELGQKVYLSVCLPEPVGSIGVDVTVVRLAPSSNRVNNYVGVSFMREVEGLETLLLRLQNPAPALKKTG